VILAAHLDDDSIMFLLASTIYGVIPHPESPSDACLVVCQAFPYGIKVKQNATEFGMEWLLVLNAEPNFEVIDNGTTPRGSMH
jgi:hypothetical protein